MVRVAHSCPTPVAWNPTNIYLKKKNNSKIERQVASLSPWKVVTVTWATYATNHEFETNSRNHAVFESLNWRAQTICIWLNTYIYIYAPTFTEHIKANVGKYTLHGLWVMSNPFQLFKWNRPPDSWWLGLARLRKNHLGNDGAIPNWYPNYHEHTIPEIPLENRPSHKEWIVFQPSIFRGELLVSGSVQGRPLLHALQVGLWRPCKWPNING